MSSTTDGKLFLYSAGEEGGTGDIEVIEYERARFFFVKPSLKKEGEA